MNRIVKFLSGLSVKERVVAKECLDLVKYRKFEGLDFKKLKGFNNLYRVRQARIRIIFFMDERKIEIIKVDKRSDNTYKSL